MALGLFMVNPIIMVNLGAEMIYIIDQRLRAQNISAEKSQIVLNDLITTLFSHQFQPTLFKPSKTFSQNFTRKLFDQIAHCSIMKLNEASMGKLYDLMTMCFKRQVLLASSPHELYHISMQHFDGVSRLLKSDGKSGCLSVCKDNFVKIYQKLSIYDYFMIRSEILKYLANKQIRVQIFLLNHWQNQDGTFALQNNRMGGLGVKVPGDIIMFDTDGNIKSRSMASLKSAKDFNENPNKYFFEGVQTDLAKNMYTIQEEIDERRSNKQIKGSDFQQTLSQGLTHDNYRGDDVKEELNKLALLIKSTAPTEEQMQQGYSINILKRGSSSTQSNTAVDDTFDDIIILDKNQASKTSLIKQNIDKLFSEFNLNSTVTQKPAEEEEEDDDDLLAMMDMASNKNK